MTGDSPSYGPPVPTGGRVQRPYSLTRTYPRYGNPPQRGWRFVG